MGRKSKNKTYEQILEDGRIRFRKYYQLHKEEVKQKVRDRYNRLKQEYHDSINKDNS